MFKYTTVLTLGVITALTLSSCDALNNEEDESKSKEKKEISYKEIAINDLYSMEVSEKMKSTDQLNEDASLQYYSLVDDKYIVVIDESLSDIEMLYEFIGEFDESKSLLENYAESQFDALKETMRVSNVSEWNTMEINGMDALRITCSGELYGTTSASTAGLAYNLLFVEGESSLYSIMSWTLEDKKSDFYDEQMHMFNSLKEIGERKEDPDSDIF